MRSVIHQDQSGDGSRYLRFAVTGANAAGGPQDPKAGR